MLSEAAKWQYGRSSRVKIKRNPRERHLETPDDCDGLTIRLCEWAPAKRTRMVKNRIPECQCSPAAKEPLA